MNYLVTDKHEFLKLNTILSESQSFSGYHECGDVNDPHLTRPKTIAEWLADGWIVEQQKPEFTKADMIAFADYWVNTNWHTQDECFNMWLSKRNESKIK